MTNPHLPPAIALIAPAMGSGKSTVARYLSTRYGYEIAPFARPMKLMIAELLRAYAFSEEEIEYALGRGKEGQLQRFPHGMTARRLLQTLGTDWGRRLISDELWIGAWWHSTRQYACVVVDDCRFLNEYRFIRQYRNSQIWRITRQSAVITSAHASEGELNDVAVDHELTNDSTVADLHAKIDAILQGHNSL